MKLDKYKGPITRIKSNQLHSSESEKHILDEKEKKLYMAERNEERCEEPHEERWEERHEERREERWEEKRHEERQIFINLRRIRDSPLDLWGEQHEIPLLPKVTLKTF